MPTSCCRRQFDVVAAIAAVAFCGELEAIARYHVNTFIQDRTHTVIPVGTIIINVIGSLILGKFLGLHFRHGLSNTIELAIGTGLCGGFNTFSSLMFESTQLVQKGADRQVGRIWSLYMILESFAAAIGLAVNWAF